MAYEFLALDTTTGKPKYVSTTSYIFVQETPTGVVDGTNTTFGLSFSPVSAASISLYLDRLISKQTEYTVNLVAKTVTFATAPKLAQDLYVVYAR